MFCNAMNGIKLKITCIFWLSIALSACQTSEYTRLVQSELASGQQFNEMLFGMQMGAPRQSFFDRCTQLNKEKKVTQGKGGIFVEYRIFPKDSSKIADVIEMQFYGIFKDSILSGMDMRFSYSGWSPWNDQYQPKALIEPLKDSLLRWMPGNDFLEIQLDEPSMKAWVKVDGNRQIKMYPFNDYQVAVKIENLLQK